jgi:hypothetical protein
MKERKMKTETEETLCFYKAQKEATITIVQKNKYRTNDLHFRLTHQTKYEEY